jgi:hypothetical protein
MGLERTARPPVAAPTGGGRLAQKTNIKNKKSFLEYKTKYIFDFIALNPIFVYI